MDHDEACKPNKPFPSQAVFGQCSVTATEPKLVRCALQKLHDRTPEGTPKITVSYQLEETCDWLPLWSARLFSVLEPEVWHGSGDNRVLLGKTLTLSPLLTMVMHTHPLNPTRQTMDSVPSSSVSKCNGKNWLFAWCNRAWHCLHRNNSPTVMGSKSPLQWKIWKSKAVRKIIGFLV